MPLYVKDQEADRLAGRLAAIRKVSKAEVVRQALRHEMEREVGTTSLVVRGVAFMQALRAKSRPADGLSADKAFIDSLYGDS